MRVNADDTGEMRTKALCMGSLLGRDTNGGDVDGLLKRPLGPHSL